ncbi:hypothetical protein L1275_001917 [Flavobacterium sp. HSC-61S13]|nr:hypothetical protein [Flavobacterium sp. HSC-61S13]
MSIRTSAHSPLLVKMEQPSTYPRICAFAYPRICVSAYSPIRLQTNVFSIINSPFGIILYILAYIMQSFV